MKQPRRRKRAGAARRQPGANFLVVTGMSGAGKSHAIRALEDLGYYCVDNLPTSLIPVMADLTLREGVDHPRIAVVADVRERGFTQQFPDVWRRLSAAKALKPKLVFLEASDAALLRRFSETRRPHPLAPDRPVVEALKEERRMLSGIRTLASEIIDTSDLTVHELRELFNAMERDRGRRKRLIVTLESFGFKHGVPIDADLVFDCRFLPNPHFVDGLRRKTGKDKAVVDFMRKSPVTRGFEHRLQSFLTYLMPHYVAEGKSYLTVAIGCTGGRHRSVYLAELLRRQLGALPSVSTRVRHRDLSRDVT